MFVAEDQDGVPEGMQRVVVEVEWHSCHAIVVPEGFRLPSTLDGFPPDALEAMKPTAAELVDWE